MPNSGITYMNRPSALLHRVGREEVGDACKPVQKPVLKAKHWRRPDECRLGVYVAYDFLAPSLFVKVFSFLLTIAEQ